ncbi:MAG: exodeoxyribonuclease V subunit alpha [Pseudomonadota bacterium]
MNAIPETPAAALERLAGWAAQGWIRPLDRALAGFLAEQCPEAPPTALLLAALASHQAGRGHVCLDLAAAADDVDAALGLAPEDPAAGPPPSACLPGDRAGLTAALDEPRLVGDGEGTTPLVLEGGRLYLRRYREAEAAIAAAVAARSQGLDQRPEPAALRPWLDALFGPPPAETDWQRVAAAAAAGGRLTVITGGPGTGKTTTVVRLLALLQGVREGQRPLRMALAAPTGKAAARLGGTVAAAVAGLTLPEGGEAVRAELPTGVTTLHRLLGGRPDSRRFRFDADNPLPVDLLVVDEASMVDLELMAATLAALPPRARLVLLGDKDQLASVEAGAVLGELCHRAEGGHYPEDAAAWLEAATGTAIPEPFRDPAGRPLDGHVVQLRHSHRFGADSGIGRLAAAVNAGEAGTAEALFREGLPDLVRPDTATPEAAARLAADGLAPALARVATGPAASGPEGREAWAEAVLAELGGFQLLAAVRQGPWGVEGLNRRVEATLAARGALDPAGTWYPGRPVMVTRNDPALGLANGDVGITLPGEEPGALRVAFPAPEGGVRWVSPARLEAVETVFAMTVHKAQGSEFRHAALVLPDRRGPVLTRELVYTAITRAAHRFTLLEGAPGILAAAVGERVQRASGLRERLGG